MSAMDLIIFDCDGVLVDSELITNREFVRMLNEIGLDVTLADMFERFVGKSMPQCYALIEAMLGKALPEDFDAAYVTRTAAAMRRELKSVAGVESVIDALIERRIDYCVASSGTHAKMQTTLGITGLLPRFEGRLFSVTEVARSKPAPDVYLHAAARRGVLPMDCVVLEDSPTGVSAARAAGMTVYGYCALSDAAKLRDAGAHYTFKHMSELPALWFRGPPRHEAVILPR